MLRHEIMQADANRDFLRVLISRALVDADLAAALKAHYKDSRMPQLVQRLKHFQTDGSLDRSVDLETLAATITTFAFGLGFMQQVVLSEDPKYLEGMIENIAATIVQGYRRNPVMPPVRATGGSCVARRPAAGWSQGDRRWRFGKHSAMDGAEARSRRCCSACSRRV